MLKALYMGLSAYLPLAYPHELRESISRKVHILPPIGEGAAWKQHGSILAEAEVILATWGMPVLDAEFLAAAPRLRAVFYAAGSVKHFATPESYERGIQITSAWQANALPVAEYALATILLGLKKFWLANRLMQNGQFSRALSSHYGICGANVGLVSMGSIGQRVAMHLSKHELNVLAYDPFLDTKVAAEMGVTLVSLSQLFEESDVVSIHTPWLPETEKMIDGPLLRTMRSGASLINTSRGAVIDEKGLCEVLEERPDLTAVLDVTYPEPPTEDSLLRHLDNVILTPHIAGSMGGEIARMGAWMLGELDNYLNNRPLEYEISQERLIHMA